MVERRGSKSKENSQREALENLKRAIIAAETAPYDLSLEERDKLEEDHLTCDQEVVKLKIPLIHVSRAYLDAMSKVSHEKAQILFNQIVEDQTHRKTLKKLASEFNLIIPD